MEDFKTLDELIEIISNSSYKIIGIDGFDQQGKTPLAKDIASKTDFKAIDVDDYFHKLITEGIFFDNLDLERLKEEILKNEKVVLSGIQLLKILKEIGLQADYLIYCDKGYHYSDWERYKQENLTFSEALDVERSNLQRIEQAMSNSNIPTVIKPYHIELLKYTYDYLPFRKADAFFAYRE